MQNTPLLAEGNCSYNYNIWFGNKTIKHKCYSYSSLPMPFFFGTSSYCSAKEYKWNGELHKIVCVPATVSKQINIFRCLWVSISVCSVAIITLLILKFQAIPSKIIPPLDYSPHMQILLGQGRILYSASLTEQCKMYPGPYQKHKQWHSKFI